MKCEICGREIVVVCERISPTVAGMRVLEPSSHTELGPPLLRCGCYDCEGHEDCPYHIADGVVVRDKPPKPPEPGSFDALVVEFIVPPLLEFMNQPSVLDQLRARQTGGDEDGRNS